MSAPKPSEWIALVYAILTTLCVGGVLIALVIA